MLNIKSDLERPRFTNDQVIVEANIVHPEICMKLNRVRCFIRFICHAPVSLTRFVLAQFGSGFSWIDSVVEDVEFFWFSDDDIHSSMASPKTDFQAWIEVFCAKPTVWKNIFRKACR